MLVSCPECKLQVSNKALACPHCGFPLTVVKSKPKKKNTKRRRLPNGFGQITEIKGKYLRKPFRAMVTVGKNSQGRPIVKPLKPESYFETYNDAYAALVEYNMNPYDLSDGLSVKELYEKWSVEYFKTLKSSSSSRSITSAWAYCSSIYDVQVREVRARHIKYCMENGTVNIKGEVKKPSSGIQERIKSLFNLMLDYALEYELVDKNYARTFNLSDEVFDDMEKTKRGHLPFTDDEIKKLWENISFPYVDVLLIQCYSGWRPQELGLIRLENVHLNEDYIIGGMKTEAGSDRIVPIHPLIKSLIEARYKQATELGSEYLLNCTDVTTHKNSLKMTYDKYRHRFDKIKEALSLNPEHRAHDGRMHFITMAKKYNVDEYAIKYIVGHAITDLTEKVYTERDTKWLFEEMKKIKCDVISAV